MIRKLLFFCALIACLTSGCLNSSTGENSLLHPTFYHWESHLSADSTLLAHIEQLESRELFVRVFDVVWENDRPEPTAIMSLGDTVGLPQLTPVVFITNDVWRKISHNEEGIYQLASDILYLCEKTLGKTFVEIQIDSDWTKTTKKTYFHFLRQLRELNRELTISCSIRLHQYKDMQSQGIPPVDRGVLMAYNVGNLNKWEEDNSIINSSVTRNYLQGDIHYPLPLDLGIAVYDWGVVYRRGKLAYLINEPDINLLERDTAQFYKISDRRYECLQAGYYEGLYLYRGDLIRLESAPVSSIESQKKLLQEYIVSFPGQRLMIYRIRSRLWSDTPYSGYPGH